MRFVLFLVTSFAIAGDFTTSLGDVYPYMISAITTDAAGNTYIVGSRALGGSFTNFSNGGTDVFVSKLDPNGNLLFTDTFGGNGFETGIGIALDPSGNIYIAGGTTSIDFPLSKALQTQPSIFGTGFIMKLSNDGSTILYSTYFGGIFGSSTITALATDANGNLYLTGTTTSPDFPHTAGMPFGPAGPQQANVILTSISAAGNEILYSGVLPGFPGSSQGQVGVGVDAAGSAYFVGNKANTGFVAKVSASGTGLSYLTSLPDIATAMAVDPAGNVYVAEYGLSSPTLPIKGSLVKLNPTGSALVWTNNLGGAAGRVQSITVDASGSLWAGGTALSAAFPSAAGWSTGTDLLVGLNSGGSQLTFSQLYPTGTVQQSLAVDSSGSVHAAGQTGLVSAINPNAAPTPKIFAFQSAFGGNSSARVAPAEVISIYGPNIGPAAATTAAPVNGFYPTTLAGVQVQFNGANIPLLYVSANQINAVVPIALSAGDSVAVRIISGTTVIPSYPVWLADSAPQVYPTVLNQDGTINSQTNPAKAGSIVTFYATGFQTTFPGLADGQVATAAHDVCFTTCAVIGGATIVYAGAAPGIVAGVTQFNVKLPATAFRTVAVFNFFPFGSLSEPFVSVWVGP